MKFNPLLYMLSAMSVLHILLFSVLPIVLRFAALRPGPVVLTGGAVALGPQIVGAPSCICCVYTKLLRSKCETVI